MSRDAIKNMKKKKGEITIRSSAAEYLTFVASTGNSSESFEMRYEDENIWLTQKMMATLYDVSKQTISQHIQRIYDDGELVPESTVKKYLTVQTEERFKGLKKENLRDNMTTLELVLNMLAEATTTEISKQKAPETFSENVEVARAGGKVAGDARKAVEAQTGVPVITSQSAAQLNQVVTDMIEGVTAEGKNDSSTKIQE